MGSWLRKLLPPRVIDGQVVPPDARVDPATFPEDQFPVYCPKCRYLLRGLTGDRCPECGIPFDRGRLLIEQYVFSPGRWHFARSYRMAKWGLVIGLSPIAAFAAFALVTPLLIWPVAQPRMSIDTALKIVHWALVATVAGTAFWVVSIVLFLRLTIVTHEKRRQVARAIDRSSPEFQEAQKRRRPSVIFALAALGLILYWEAREERGWLGYYTSSPARVLIPIAGAIVIGVLIFFASRLWRRWESRHGDPDT